MPSIEMTNGQVHSIKEPETVGGCIRRIEAAKALVDSKGEPKRAEFARFKDEDDDPVGVNPDNVSSVY